MKYLQRIFASITFTIIASIAVSQNTAEITLRNKHYNIEKSSLALQGYDPISYFLKNPKKGTPTFSYKYKGISYYFSNQKNLDLFKSSPEKFEPAYGGWCAYAMGATGEKVEIDPETYKIVNSKLYLFYNSLFNNTLPKWNANENSLNKKADINWSKIYK